MTSVSQLNSTKSPRWGGKRLTATLGGTLALVLSLVGNPALAADPFRTTNPHPIGDQTEAAFEAMFEEGNYVKAAQLLQTAETNEPLAYALKASLNYTNEDLDAMGENARLTRETAEKLKSTDPLRGNLYIAVGYFLEGAHAFLSDGVVRSTPAVLSRLQQVFDSLNAAAKIDPNDPELNLLKGYMDLMLSVNLPFANPQQAIERLQTYAAPVYVSQRGIAIGYRDLNQQDQALTAVDKAIQQAPNNPELFYLKAQILRRQSDGFEGEDQRRLRRQSLNFFRQAWALKTQLPTSTVHQIDREACRTFQQLRNRNPDTCSGDTAINWQRDQTQATETGTPPATGTSSPGTSSPATSPGTSSSGSTSGTGTAPGTSTSPGTSSSGTGTSSTGTSPRTLPLPTPAPTVTPSPQPSSGSK